VEPFSIGSVLAAGLRATPRALLGVAPLLVLAAAAIVVGGVAWGWVIVVVEIAVAATSAGAGFATGLRRIGLALLAVLMIALVTFAISFAFLLPALSTSNDVAGESMGVIWLLVMIILYSRWFVAIPAAVVERRYPLAALSRSHELTRGHRGAMAGLILLVGASYVALLVGVAWIPADGDRWFGPLGLLVWIAFAAVRACLSAAAFAQLRRDTEGAAPEELAEVFE
jgi:hypothetical protein